MSKLDDVIAQMAEQSGLESAIAMIEKHNERDNERRLAIVAIGEHFILEMFRLNSLIESDSPEAPEGIYLPVITDAPRDAKIERVSHDWSRQSFIFILSHPSFSIIPPGDMIPVIQCNGMVAFRFHKTGVKT